MTKNTIDDHILSDRSTHDKDCGVTITADLGNCDCNKLELKQALYQDLMALVGEDDVPEVPLGSVYSTSVIETDIRNQLRAEIRQNINQYFKRGEGDE